MKAVVSSVSPLRRTRIAAALALPALMLTGLVIAQPAAPSHPAPPVQVAPTIAPQPSEKDLAATQEELIRLLRLSPTLTGVVARDPSLLSNPEYVRRNNPELAQYLQSHPEIALNPDFYLFSNLENRDGRRDRALERSVWPELQQPQRETYGMEEVMHDLLPTLAFFGFLVALVWLTRQFLENRRWGRVLKLQTEVHGKLIDKMGSNEELMAYMETEAGRRFLEAAPIPVAIEPDQRVPSAVARVLTPLQVGLVLALIGVGFLGLRHANANMALPMLVLGVLFLMPGVGFILSAGIAWILAARLGLMPERAASANPPIPTFESRDRQ